MKPYVIFSPETGDIVSCVHAPEAQMPPQGPLPDGSGLHVKYGQADPDKQRVKWGRIVAKTKTAMRNWETVLTWQSFESERHRLLSASDWTQVPDVPMSDDLRQQWKDYRQALRDLPEHTADPANPAWPEQPKK